MVVPAEVVHLPGHSHPLLERDLALVPGRIRCNRGVAIHSWSAPDKVCLKPHVPGPAPATPALMELYRDWICLNSKLGQITDMMRIDGQIARPTGK